MTTDSNTAKEPAEALDDESVSKYLIENPDFFERKADLLLELTIPDGNRGAISLLQRQVELFRERNRDLQNNINDFIFNAEENDALFEKTRIVILKLLKSDNLTELSKVIEDTLKTEFSAHASSLLFISDSAGNSDNEGLQFVAVEPTKNVLGKLFDKKRTFCCELNSEQGKFLFPESQKEILSAAVIPVHPAESLGDKKTFGTPLLVIGSDKHNHFNSSLDTLFLDFIGEILATKITRLVG